MKPIKIIPSKLLKTVEKMSIGEIGWIKYSDMWVDKNKDLYVRLEASVSRVPKNDGSGYFLKIKRVKEGIIAYYTRLKQEWEYDYADTFNYFNYPEDSLPVIASSDAQYRRLLKNLSQEDLEDKIHEKMNELFRIENEFELSGENKEKNHWQIAERAKKCQKEIDILVIKREKFLDNKEKKERQKKTKKLE